MQPQQLDAALLGVEGGVLEGDPDAESDLVGLGDDVVAGDLGPAAGGNQQGAEHAHAGGLAGAVGAEEAEDLPRRDPRGRRP